MFWKRKPQGLQIENPMLIAQRTENAQETLSVYLSAEQLGNPSEAGVMLADIARHMARALADTSYEGTEEDALRQIAKLFNAELQSPTQPIKGGMIQ
ncbi:MAG: DUF5076 domain-containing protein [Pseudomonadota bacterium]